MKRLRGFFSGEDQHAERSHRSTVLPRRDGEMAESSDEHKEPQLQPCGPECWLKAFLAYPEPPKDTILLALEASPATEEYRRSIATELYEPIHAYQTRLIKLLPGAQEDFVTCELLTADLIALPGLGLSATGEMVSYDCLSYSWGYPVFSHRVLCNGIEVPVIASLYEALRYLRMEDRPKYLWIDAFCINQFDDMEKSKQVQNMLLVYQKCEAVRAWLGVPEVQDRMAARYLLKLAKNDTPIRSNTGKVHDATCATAYAKISADLHHFFNGAWWCRSWIRQEVFASRTLTVHSGPDTYDYSIIGRAIDVWQQCQPIEHPDSALRVQHLPNQDCFETMRQSRIAIKRWLKAGTKLPAPVRCAVDTGAWLESLLAGSRFGATDPRDKVYGIVGMLEARSQALDLEAPHSEDPHRATFMSRVDYSKFEKVVHQEIIKFLINRDGNLLPLCIFRDRTGDAETEPSWTLSLDQNSRSWYLASHLNSVTRSEKHDKDETNEIDSLLECLGMGYVDKAVQVNPDADGELECSGFRIGTVRLPRTLHDGRLHKDISMERIISTSPPLPNRAGFHHFIRSCNELQREANYRLVNLEWLDNAFIDLFPHPATREAPRVDVPRSPTQSGTNNIDLRLMVSQAARNGDDVVLLKGSPLPMVVRPRDGADRSYRFLGPACWARCNDSPDLAFFGSPGILETGQMHLRASNLELQSFRLV